MTTEPIEQLEPYMSVVPDPRSEEEKARDFNHEEIALAAPVKWVEKTPDQWKKYTMRDQDGSGSCCAQSAAKGGETITGKVLSAHPVYRSRSNYPQQGMWLQNVGEIMKKQGTTTEANDPSQRMNEEQINQPFTEQLKQILRDNPDKIGGYVMVNAKDIDAIAQAIEMHKHCLMIVHGSIAEWNEKPEYKPGTNMNLGHCVCGVDYFLQDGEKCILIDDSWGKVTSIGDGGQRVITESYLKARFDGAMYFLPATAPSEEGKPHHLFTKTLTYGLMGDGDVKALQEIMKYEGVFPAGTSMTGNFLNITANSLKKWQVKHGIMDFATEKDPRKIRFGNKSIAEANKLYS